MRAAKDTVGQGAGLAPAVGAHQDLAAVLVPEAASPTPDPGAGAVASLAQLVGLLSLKRARNVLPQVGPNLQLLWIGSNQDQGQDLLTVAIEFGLPGPGTFFLKNILANSCKYMISGRD